LENQPTSKLETVPTNTLDIIKLDDRFLADALALSNEANWNQVADDWAMMITAGEAIGFQDTSGRLIASALTLPYGDQFGWISMVLVTQLRQKQGLATQLLNSCIQRLEDKHLVPLLDATPAGENVYRPLGFLPYFGFERWEHEAVENIFQTATQRNNKIGMLERFDPSEIIEKDQKIFGGDRRTIIESLIERSSEFSAVAENNGGFLLGRDGRTATHIGPISANSPKTAIALLDHALTTLSGTVFIDACNHQKKFIVQLKKYGFRRQRPFLRMAKGYTKKLGQPEKMFAMAGPELG
jgi:GNAT superfamily N-acetyltransferase